MQCQIIKVYKHCREEYSWTIIMEPVHYSVVQKASQIYSILCEYSPGEISQNI